MPARFFGQYLMEKGIITREMFLDAVALQSGIEFPFWALAVSRGCLSAEQMAEIDPALRSAASNPLAFAARVKMLPFHDMETLAEGTAPRGLYLGEALIRKGFLSLQAFGEAYARYRKDCPEGVGVTSALPADGAIANREIVDSVVESLIDVFVHYTRQVVRVAGPATCVPTGLRARRVFSQMIAGDVRFRLALALEDPLLLAIASEMLHQEQKSVDEDALDAVSEFLNVVTGLVCSKLGEAALSVLASGAPEVLDADAIARTPSSSVVAVDLETMKASLHLLILFASADEGRGNAS